MSAPWIWKDVSATLYSGRYTLSYSRGRCVSHSSKHGIYIIFATHTKILRRITGMWIINIAKWIFLEHSHRSNIASTLLLPCKSKGQRSPTCKLSNYCLLVLHPQWFAVAVKSFIVWTETWTSWDDDPAVVWIGPQGLPQPGSSFIQAADES